MPPGTGPPPAGRPDPGPGGRSAPKSDGSGAGTTGGTQRATAPGVAGQPGTAGGRRAALGRASEEAAARFLRRRGFVVLERNVRFRAGEIDIVASRAGVLVFVEVKAKAGGGFGAPEEMVTAAKRRRLTLLARWYLARKGWEDRSARFDVVAVTWEGGRPLVRHIPDAFCAGEG